MTRVLFVCLGNICRSPMAHGIFAHEVAQQGLSDAFEVDSAGTAAYHAGEDPDPRTMRVLGQHGIGLRHASRQVVGADFERFDVILAMDKSNYSTLRSRCPAPHRDKVRMMLEPLGGGEVGDPYYGGPDGFDTNFRELTEASRAWIERLS